MLDIENIEKYAKGIPNRKTIFDKCNKNDDINKNYGIYITNGILSEMSHPDSDGK